MRHGEVHNPDKILYGRLPDYHLSDKGRAQAQRVADWLADHDIVYVVASPLERAQETAAPIAATHGLPIDTDDDLIESGNVFEGERVSPGDGALRDPRNWWHLRNPRTPSWGEPYDEIAERMTGRAAPGQGQGARVTRRCASAISCRSETLRRAMTGQHAAPLADRGEPDVQPRLADVVLLPRRRRCVGWGYAELAGQ